MPIGLWVLKAACAQLARWQASACTRGLTIAVNVSARQFHRPDFVASVERTVRAAGIDATRLKLELTESAILSDLDETAARMNQLRELGIQFALDDFGTGYSSLSYLKRLPFAQLKIDQSFVRDMAQDQGSKAIVLAVLSLSHALGLEVIAEGVETSVQREFLFEHGCELYQGYLFGKPVPIEAWDELLDAQ
jgi:EAL domain-containing protein (putative c-di-GMP-specific phosphodiesterase class I)